MFKRDSAPRVVKEMPGVQLDRAEFERRLSLALGAEPIREWTYDGSLWRHLGFSTAGAEQDTGP